MAKPIVAIIGRPNVGKSTFFNKICGDRLSIVGDKPGVTRDRLYADAEWCGFNFTMIDTGGIEVKSSDEMWLHIRKQAEIAAETADLILFFVDGKVGLSSDDYDVADYLRRKKRDVILVVNKIDNNEIHKTFDFYELGVGVPFAISAEQSKGLGDLLDEVAARLKIKGEFEEVNTSLKIAVVGKPNAGKSSLINRLLGYERVIVSDIAGTTRDAIDTRFTYDGHDYTLIDTAGIRRKRSVEEEIEQFSVMKAFAAIRRADVVLVVIDAAEDISEQDVRIAGYVHEQGKASVILMNKWDILEKDTFTINKFNDKLKADLAFMDYFKSLYISALTGQRVDKIMNVVNEVYANSCRRITTGAFNDLIYDAISVNEPPISGGRRFKILYSTQQDINPPTFIIFVNDIKLMHFSYKRYLENSIRKAVDFSGTPINLIVRNREEK